MTIEPIRISLQSPTHPGLDELFSVFIENHVWQTRLFKELASHWENVARCLAKQPAFQGRFNRSKLDEFKRGGEPVDHCKRFLNSYKFMAGATLRSFVTALYHAGLEPLSKQICELAGDKQFYDTLIPLAQKFIAQPLPPQPPKEPLVLPNVTLLYEQMMAQQEAMRRENEELKRMKSEPQKDPEALNCGICMERKITKAIKCGHTYCDVCLRALKNSCAICRQPIEEARDLKL